MNPCLKGLKAIGAETGASNEHCTELSLVHVQAVRLVCLWLSTGIYVCDKESGRVGPVASLNLCVGHVPYVPCRVSRCEQTPESLAHVTSPHLYQFRRCLFALPGNKLARVKATCANQKSIGGVAELVLTHCNYQTCAFLSGS